MAYNLHINLSFTDCPVYGSIGGRDRVGTIRIGELFNNCYSVDGGTGTSVKRIHFYSPTGPRYGYLYEHPEDPTVPAYTGRYRTEVRDRGILFPVRRRCRIFKGTDRVDYIYPGNAVIIGNSNSQGGESHPYRLLIHEYRKSGRYINATAKYGVPHLWCDTDYEIGYAMKNQITTYAENW